MVVEYITQLEHGTKYFVKVLIIKNAIWLKLIELSSINKVGLVWVSFCSNTGSIRILDDPYWTSRKNSLELIELSSINNVNSLV